MLKCRKSISNYCYDQFYKEEIEKAMKKTNNPANAKKQANKELNKMRKKITEHGYNKFYEEAMEKAKNEVEASKHKNPKFDWKNSNTPRTHREWFRGMYTYFKRGYMRCGLLTFFLILASIFKLEKRKQFFRFRIHFAMAFISEV